MKLPRDISGEALCKALQKLGYTVTRQTGSHVRLSWLKMPEHHITVPNHQSIKIGTLNSILQDIALQQKTTKQALLKTLGLQKDIF